MRTTDDHDCCRGAAAVVLQMIVYRSMQSGTALSGKAGWLGATGWERPSEAYWIEQVWRNLTEQDHAT